MARYLVQPLPDIDANLLPDDEIWLTYDVDWDWDFIAALRIGDLEQRLESDARFVLKSYSYDQDKKQVTFKFRLRRRDEMPEKVYLAGVFNPSALLSLIVIATGLVLAGGIGYWLIERVQIWRLDVVIEALRDEGMLSPEQEAEIFARMGHNPDGTPITSAIASVGSGMGLIALAVLAWIFFGNRQ